MKKLMMLLAALLLALGPALPVTPALAETAPLSLPVEIMPHTEGLLHMADALEKATGSLAVLPADCLTRAELVRMDDDSCQWIVTIFDLTNFSDGWCITLDASDGDLLSMETTTIGYFDIIHMQWEQEKGPEALWSLEDKLLFDTLYTMQPTYGLPMEGDLSQFDALMKAMAAVGVTSASEYQVGYGYLMGAGETSGVWEVWFMQGDEMIYKVNLDAMSGEILLIEPDEEGNG